MKKLLHERLREHGGASIDFECAGRLLTLRCSAANALADEIECDYIPKPIGQKGGSMKKLLHERLREYEEDRDGRPYFMFSDMYEGWMSWQTAQHLADEIERYYIPRPRFEDGEPIQWGDEWIAPEYFREDRVETHKHFSVVHKSQLEEWDQVHDNTPEYVYGIDFFRPDDPEYRVKRPQPKVLDADGVEIKVGDAVWEISTGWKYTIIDLCEDCSYVKVGDSTGRYCGDIMPERLTHKEPDSREKCIEDLSHCISWHEEREPAEDSQEARTQDALKEAEKWYDRISLIERGA